MQHAVPLEMGLSVVAPRVGQMKPHVEPHDRLGVKMVLPKYRLHSFMYFDE